MIILYIPTLVSYFLSLFFYKSLAYVNDTTADVLSQRVSYKDTHRRVTPTSAITGGRSFLVRASKRGKGKPLRACVDEWKKDHDVPFLKARGVSLKDRRANRMQWSQGALTTTQAGPIFLGHSQRPGGLNPTSRSFSILEEAVKGYLGNLFLRFQIHLDYCGGFEWMLKPFFFILE